MITIHELKTWPQYFGPVNDGLKTFEFRLNDRNFKVGDGLVLREYEPYPAERYTGRECFVEVTYIAHAAPGLPSGYCLMAIRKAQR